MSSCTLQFLPSGVTVRVEPGTLLHQAAAEAGVRDLHLPCGGRASCGRCLVEVVSGDFRQEASGAAESALRRAGFVLACQTRALSDMVLRVPDPEAASLRVVTESHLLLDQALLPETARITPPLRKAFVRIPPPVTETGYGDLERLALALSGALEDPVGRLDCPLPLLRRLPDLIREREGEVTASLASTGAGLRLVDLEPGDTTGDQLGVACDLGTTTVALHLVDLAAGEVLTTRSAPNRQAARGADVITRIDYARTPERLEELRGLALETINGLVEEASAEAGADPGRVGCYVLAGNTTMTHLLLGLPPGHIRETPYVPVTNAPPPLTAEEVGLPGRRGAPVLLAPGVGSYVGGDITAGLLATHLARGGAAEGAGSEEGVALYMDIGTNGEIVLGTSEWLTTCACSAGPAFEGSGIRCGMRAARGAIERVTLGPVGESLEYDVIGGGRPAGICGSGLVSLLGELLCHGVIDQAGRFHPDAGCPRVVRADNTWGYLMESADRAAGGCDLVLTTPDIENLLRSKAAIYAGCDLLLEKVGLTWEAVSDVIIAGGFGRYLDVERAILIGLLPDLPLTRFHYVGNASLAGAYRMLLSRESREEAERLASKMTYVDLSSESGYMDRYVAALFLPHTDLGRFPNVAERLRPAAA